MIVSMKPPYNITVRMLTLTTSISEKLGEVKAHYLDKPSPNLRKQNKIKTIHSSLKIEGNTVSGEKNKTKYTLHNNAYKAYRSRL